MKNTPRIIIGHSRFLNPIFAEWGKIKSENNDWKPMESEALFEKISKYRGMWQPYEEKVCQGLMEALDLHFLENVINVYIVSGQKGGFSDPLIISPGVPEIRFVDLLAHELVHRLLTFNAEEIRVGKIFDVMFPDMEDQLTKNHIIVHAVLQYLYIDVLKEPVRLENDISFHKNNPGYADAWKIVTDRGYQQLLKEFKSHYPNKT
jgi:hypothetical protein